MVASEEQLSYSALRSNEVWCHLLIYALFFSFLFLLRRALTFPQLCKIKHKHIEMDFNWGKMPIDEIQTHVLCSSAAPATNVSVNPNQRILKVLNTKNNKQEGKHKAAAREPLGFKEGSLQKKYS